MIPVENIVASCVFAVAPTRCSLFSPLSHSLYPPPAALVLQARAFCFANGASSSPHFDDKRKNRTDQLVYPVFWRRRRDLNSRTGLSRSTPLAGAPLRPLEYFSKYSCYLPKVLTFCSMYYTLTFAPCQELLGYFYYSSKKLFHSCSFFI